MEKPDTFNDAALFVAEEIADLITAKQKDYGHSNITDFGEYGVLVRLNDKVARLKNLLTQKKEPANEPIVDTWRDIAGYAIIALMLYYGWFELELEVE